MHQKAAALSQVKRQVTLLFSSTDKQRIDMLTKPRATRRGFFCLSINCSVLIFCKFLSHKAQDYKAESVKPRKLLFRMIVYQQVETGHVHNEIKNLSASGSVLSHPLLTVAC
jgi:hypothetical protein